MAATRRNASVEAIREAEAMRDKLHAVLKGAGIVLPSLRIDPVSCAAEVPGSLIDLGRCNLDTARKLVAALERCGE
jgi:hypothetical protein